jgi:hypothetical protein
MKRLFAITLRTHFSFIILITTFDLFVPRLVHQHYTLTPPTANDPTTVSLPINPLATSPTPTPPTPIHRPLAHITDSGAYGGEILPKHRDRVHFTSDSGAYCIDTVTVELCHIASKKRSKLFLSNPATSSH